MTKRSTLRGADIVAQTIERIGVDRIFSVSGNHIMPVYDALIETGIGLIHCRHEAACVHMADAYARITGQVGVALVTGGPGHANALGALYTALASEAPMMLFSGHASLEESGRGAFQELRQDEMARPVTKSAWTTTIASNLGHDVASAARIARSGRPGPVQVNLPIDILEQVVEVRPGLWPSPTSALAVPMPLAVNAAESIVTCVRAASRPVILCGPAFCSFGGRACMAQLEEFAGVPVFGMESPRGINDPSLGSFAEVLARADLIVLIGKPLDFTLRFGDAPFVAPDCSFVVVDPDATQLDRVKKYKGDRMLVSALADAAGAMQSIIVRMSQPTYRSRDWLVEARWLAAYRPEPGNASRGEDEPVHPLDLCAALQGFFDEHPEGTLVCDGGEIGQWPQAMVKVNHRLINGVAGAIGPSLPYALAAKCARPAHPVVAIMGDGTFGFHMAELDTAVRHELPVIVVVGNDARWNAEFQIQRRHYGAERARYCDLLPSRYERVAEALGGHAEFVACAAELGPALRRAAAAKKPTCINVRIESVAAPLVKRATLARA